MVSLWPSTASATATKRSTGVTPVPWLSRLPYQMRLDATKCHACHTKDRGATGDQRRPSASPELAQCSICSACHIKWRSMSPKYVWESFVWNCCVWESCVWKSCVRQLGVRKLHVKELCVTKSCPRVVCEAGGQAGRRSRRRMDTEERAPERTRTRRCKGNAEILSWTTNRNETTTVLGRKKSTPHWSRPGAVKHSTAKGSVALAAPHSHGPRTARSWSLRSGQNHGSADCPLAPTSA